MKFKKNNLKSKKKRIRENQFAYLPYPTFICCDFIKQKFYFKCFKCNKVFPTRHRLSRHFIQTKCLQKSPRYKIFLFPKKNNKRDKFG